jgi:hypothetical protein
VLFIVKQAIPFGQVLTPSRAHVKLRRRSLNSRLKDRIIETLLPPSPQKYLTFKHTALKRTCFPAQQTTSNALTEHILLWAFLSLEINAGGVASQRRQDTDWTTLHLT